MPLHGSYPTGTARRRVLLLGGVRSGRTRLAREFADEVDDGTVWFVSPTATADPAAGAGDEDPRFEDGRWQRVRLSGDPGRLVTLVAHADPADMLVIDDVDAWLGRILAESPADLRARVVELVEAVERSPARLVLVSHEVGLGVPASGTRSLAEAVGAANRRLAEACEAVALVVAGQPLWIKQPAPVGAEASGGTAGRTYVGRAPGPVSLAPVADSGAAGPGPEPTEPPEPSVEHSPASPPEPPLERAPVPAPEPPGASRPEPASPPGPPAVPPVPAATVPVPPGDEHPAVAPPAYQAVSDEDLVLHDESWPGGDRPPPDGSDEDRPLPDEAAATAATAGLAALDVPGRGLGRLAGVVGFAAATQGRAAPTPFRAPRAVLLYGDDRGSASTGQDPAEVARRLSATRSGDGPLARVAALAGVSIEVVELPADAVLERTTPLLDATVDSWLARGTRLADDLVDRGTDVLVLAADGAGLQTVATAVIAALTGGEAAALLPPVLTGSGAGRGYDDNSWMARCVAVRDALYRLGYAGRDARTLLRTLAGPVVGTATGLLLQATRRRTPVLLDGPVGVAAALIARDIAGQSPHWLMLPDAGHNGAVPLAADMLDLPSLVPVGVELGEGGGALTLLPLMQAALAVAGGGPVAPDAGPQDPGTLDPGTLDPGTLDPEAQDPGPLDPGPLDPGPLDPGPLDPGPLDPGPLDTPLSEDPTALADDTAAPWTGVDPLAPAGDARPAWAEAIRSPWDEDVRPARDDGEGSTRAEPGHEPSMMDAEAPDTGTTTGTPATEDPDAIPPVAETDPPSAADRRPDSW